MGVKTIDIPAGERAYRVSDRYVFPVDVTLLSLYPHAHYLGREMRITATLPDGKTTRLLHIPRWQFHWQQEYRFATPVKLPRGTSLAMEYTYDNSAENHHNPSSPPRRVTYGLRSTDEMGNLSMQVLPASKADGRLLTRAFLERDRQANIASAEMRVRIEPSNALHHLDLGKSYVEAGRHADAIPALEAALRLSPELSTAHDYLGRALFAAGRAPRRAHASRARGRARAQRRSVPDRSRQGPGRDRTIGRRPARVRAGDRDQPGVRPGVTKGSGSRSSASAGSTTRLPRSSAPSRSRRSRPPRRTGSRSRSRRPAGGTKRFSTSGAPSISIPTTSRRATTSRA